MRLRELPVVISLSLALIVIPLLAQASPPYRIAAARVGWDAYEFRLVADGVEPLALLWRFGDGVISGDRDAYHRYRTPGEYTVIMEVTDATGALHQVQAPVSVSFFSPGHWKAWAVFALSAGAAVFLAVAARRLKRAAEECAWYTGNGSISH